MIFFQHLEGGDPDEMGIDIIGDIIATNLIATFPMDESTQHDIGVQNDPWLSKRIEKYSALVEKIEATRKAIEEAKAETAGIE